MIYIIRAIVYNVIVRKEYSYVYYYCYRIKKELR